MDVSSVDRNSAASPQKIQPQDANLKKQDKTAEQRAQAERSAEQRAVTKQEGSKGGTINTMA